MGSALAVEYIPYIGGGFVANNTAVSGSENSVNVDLLNNGAEYGVDNWYKDGDENGFIYKKNIEASYNKAFAVD